MKGRSELAGRYRPPLEPWRLSECAFDPSSSVLNEALFALGNGYIGLRGALGFHHRNRAIRLAAGGPVQTVVDSRARQVHGPDPLSAVRTSTVDPSTCALSGHAACTAAEGTTS